MPVNRIIMSALFFILLAPYLGLLTCAPENDNDVNCFDEDCQASCAGKGLDGGVCRDQICECAEDPDMSYIWEDDPDTEDTNSHIDAGQLGM